ncbi:N-acetyl-gamma-glutamyl-phosphate reductase [Streptomyces polygonati]|uniref:N-acetyl-gamma-glutamyl-phosphate reductase n=1 Tax=Streptomyces polygonati TaxID=1617087 RepID=A0ABV8HWT3_9ACTN
MTPPIHALVLGAGGHTGGEICRLLLGHPQLGRITPATRAEQDFERTHPNLLGSGLRFTPVEQARADLSAYDVAFLCTPTGEAMRLAPDLLAAGVRVIDLSADFRFADPRRFEAVHGVGHSAPELIGQAVYGATELDRERIRTARLIANPGCYAITALLALEPLLSAGLVDDSSVLHIAAVNGTTGSGSTPRREVSHAEAASSMLPYSLSGHRHAPEIEERLHHASSRTVTVDLSTAHGNFARGIHLQAGVRIGAEHREHTTRDTLLGLYTDRYGHGADGEFFVRVNSHPPQGGLTDKDYGRYPTLAGVVGSNFCHLGVDYDARIGLARLVAVTDNLIKGAAGSAIQNMNVMFGLDETAGLRSYAL